MRQRLRGRRPGEQLMKGLKTEGVKDLDSGTHLTFEIHCSSVALKQICNSISINLSKTCFYSLLCENQILVIL